MNNNLSQPKVLVIDDHYAVESSGEGFNYYDKTYFLEDYHSDRFEFLFFSGFDSDARRYSVAAVQAYIASLDELPDVILLDVMFGDEVLLGLDILRWLSEAHPTLAVVMMTSKQKSELFSETIALGAVDYLVKPLARQELHETLFRYLADDKKSALIGQEGEFLLSVKKAAQITGNMLIQTEDIHRARYLLSYAARLRNQAVNWINIDKERDFITIESEIEQDKFNVFLNLEFLPLAAQEPLAMLIGREKGECSFSAISSLGVVHAVKQHEFSSGLYAALATINIILPTLMVGDEDLFILFRHYFNMHSPRNTVHDLKFGAEDVAALFEGETGVTLGDVDAFLKKYFEIHGTPTKESLLAYAVQYAEESYSEKPYDDLRAQLDAIREEEFTLLIKALYRTKRVGKRANKSLAISKLLDKKQASTNEYDRWLKKIWQELPQEKQALCRRSGQLEQLGLKL